jgi:hypothetical protein
MHQYAGQLMTTGPQAQVYADHFIANHLAEVAGGKTYAQVSELALANPKNATYAGQVATLFKGTTLRALLLNAYGFWKMGEIAGIAAIAAFAGAALMLILSFAGLWHLRRAPETAEVLSRFAHKAKVQTASPSTGPGALAAPAGAPTSTRPARQKCRRDQGPCAA